MSERENKISPEESSGMIAECPPSRRSEMIDLEIPAPPPGEEEQQRDLQGFCSVCSEEVLPPGERSIALLTCGHKFHLDCIGSAFNAKSLMECPNCRRVEVGQWLYAAGIPSSEDLPFDWDSGTQTFSIQEPVLEDDGPNSGTGAQSRPRIFGVCQHVIDYFRDLHGRLENGGFDLHPSASEGESSDFQNTHWTELQNHHYQHRHRQQQQRTLNSESSADEVSLELALQPPRTEPRWLQELRTFVDPLSFHYGFASNMPVIEEGMDMDHRHLGGHIVAFFQVVDSSALHQAVTPAEVGVTNGHAIFLPMFPNGQDFNLQWSVLSYNTYDRFASNVPVIEELMDMDHHHHIGGHINDFGQHLDSLAAHQAVASTEVGVTRGLAVFLPLVPNDQDFHLQLSALSHNTYDRFDSEVPVAEEVMDMTHHHHLEGQLDYFVQHMDTSEPHQAVEAPEPVFLNDQDSDIQWEPLSPSNLPLMPFIPSVDAAAGSPWPTAFPAYQQHSESLIPDTTTMNLFQMPMIDRADRGRPDIGDQLMPNHGQGM